MMSVKDKIIWILYRILPEKGLFHQIVRQIYLVFLIPAVSFYLKSKHKNLVKVSIRNSALKNESFNALLSDIDVSLVIQEEDKGELVKTYLRLKKFLPMFDSPEIYTESEFNRLQSLKPLEQELIEFCWNFRKINWSLDEINGMKKSPLVKIKKQRAISKALFKMGLSEDLLDELIIPVNHSATLMKFIPPSSQYSVCYYSQYLETTKANHLKLLIGHEQFATLNCLMPGESIPENIRPFLSVEFVDAKLAIEYHELYLSKSAIRLRSAQLLDISPWMGWITFLEEKLEAYK